MEEVRSHQCVLGLPTLNVSNQVPTDRIHRECLSALGEEFRAVLTQILKPGLMGRLFYDTRKQLATTARTIGADTVGTLFSGLIATEEYRKLPDRTYRKIETMAINLTN